MDRRATNLMVGYSTLSPKDWKGLKQLSTQAQGNFISAEDF